MGGKSGIKWSVRELSETLRKRQLNKFDCNFGVSGARGDGKSTLLFKIFNSFKKHGFKQRKQQVYSQNDVKELLANQKFGYCWDDEAINSGYKRDFQQQGQIELIKLVTNYRDNFNIYGSALPFFYNLDKALRELMFMHIHIKERGIGVIFLPLEGQIHSQDPWDTKTNQKIEAKETERIRRNPSLKFRYWRLTTFAGYVFFNSMSPRQESRYLKIKQLKRAKEFQKVEGVDKERSFTTKLYDSLMAGKLTKEGLEQACLIEGRKYSVTVQHLNKILKDKAVGKTLMEIISTRLSGRKSSNIDPAIDDLVPSF